MGNETDVLTVGTTASPQYAFIPAFFAILLVGLLVCFIAHCRKTGKKIPIATCIWSGAFIAILVFLTVMVSLGLYENPVWSLQLPSFLIMGLGAIVLLRDHASTWINGRAAAIAPAMRICRDIAAIIATTILSFFALELPWNNSLSSISINNAMISLTIIGLVQTGLYFLAQRRGVGLGVGSIAWTLIGIAELFVARFKQSAIMPSDLLALGTAASVGGEYTYSITQYVLQAILCGAIALTVAAFVQPDSKLASIKRLLTPNQQLGQHSHPAKQIPPKRFILNAGGNVICTFILVFALCAWCSTVSFEDDYDLSIDSWWPLTSYSAQGFLPSFVTALQLSQIEEPEGYSEEKAQQTETEYVALYDDTTASTAEHQEAVAQYEQTKPTIIAIMNETFSDLSIYNNLNADYTGPAFINSLSNALVKGSSYVSTYAGGTCTSEFEFLTGNSMAFAGSNMQPYVQFNLSNSNSIVKQLAAEGYTSTAIHPNLATNWNRQTAYEELGFDTFLDIDDFENCETFHGAISDRATYDKILELLESGSGPQFIFDVTMQNHSPYDQGNIASKLLTTYRPIGIGNESTLAQLNEYLTCIAESDRAIEYLLNELSQLDQPIIVVFFGDHQPSISNDYNEALIAEEDEIAHVERLYQTSYFVWANYDVAGNQQISEYADTDLTALSATLLNIIGAPLTDYQKATLASRQTISVLNAFGYRTNDGIWHSLDDATETSTTIDDLSFIEYLECGNKL